MHKIQIFFYGRLPSTFYIYTSIMIDCNETQVSCKLPWDRTLWSHNQTCTTIQQYRWVWLDWAGGEYHPTVLVEDSNTDNSDPVQSSICRFAVAFFKSEQEI